MLLIIDGNSILNRAFYGIKLLTTKQGLPTNAVFGFLQILHSLQDQIKPDGIAIAFDLPDKTFRHLMFDNYKAGRKGMPDELAAQLPVIKDVLTALGCTILSSSGWEADDILGTFAKRASQAGEACVIATGDRDSLQLVNEQTKVRLAYTKMGRPESTIYDIEKIKEEYQTTPDRLIDIKALMGDSSDNIPGVAGIGEKTAVDLISRFGSLDGVYEAIESPDIRPAVKTKLVACKEMAYLSKQLATISCEVPVTLDFAAIKAGKPDKIALRNLFVRLEFYKFLSKYGLDKQEFAQQPLDLPQAEPQLELQAEPQKEIQVTPVCQVSDVQTVLKAAQKDKLIDIQIEFQSKVLTVSSGGYFAEAELEKFISVLQDVNIAKRIYDIKAAYKWLKEQGITLAGKLFDPLLAAYLINPLSTDYSLARLAQEYNDGQADGAVAFTAVCDKLTAQVQQMGMLNLLEEIEQPLAIVLAKMELAGFAVDKDGLESYGATLSAELDKLEQEIYSLAGGEHFNINSPKQLGVVLFERLGLPPKRKTKSGYSTDADVLESLSKSHPVIEQILSYRTLAKLKATYCDGLAKAVAEDGRIHTRFKQTETRTGRISSADPNLQNIPVRQEQGSRLRGFFKASEGNVLIDADYSQIELRVLAHMSGDQVMIDAFTNHIDIHTQTASQVFHMPLDMVTPLMRSRAKAVNFGIVYGIGAFSLSDDIGVSISEADQYIKSYFAVYPQVKAFLERTVIESKEKGYVTTLFGRRRPLPELASSNANLRNFGERAAKNTAVQGTAADIIKIAMVKVSDRLERENLQSRLILQVHDELIVESPLQEADIALRILQEEMEQAASLACHLAVDLHTGKNWLEAKS